MKLLMIFLILLVHNASTRRTYNSPFAYRNNWKFCKCEKSERFIKEYYHNLTCRVNSYNRTYSTFTIVGYVKKPVLTPYFEGLVLYKYGTIYREIIDVKKTNVCQISKIIKTNKLWQGINEAAEKVMPGVIHKCPYHDYIAKNISLNDLPIVSYFPQGDYKVLIYIYDSDKSEKLLNITLILSVVSPIKDSFG